MRVAWLGPQHRDLLHFLRSCGDDPIVYESRLMSPFDFHVPPEFIVSYRYRFLVPAAILAAWPRRAINLHISLLPWNRGADPNLWSFLDNTPKGVTIHEMDEHLDTGCILAQEEVALGEQETLRSSYDILSHQLEELFKRSWPAIRDGRMERRPQAAGGTVHRSADRQRFQKALVQGWDTPVASLIGKALKGQSIS